MKFAEKLKTVLASHPEIHENRRKLQAISYLAKQNPQRMSVKITRDEDATTIDLIKHTEECSYSIDSVVLVPISAYF